MLLMLPLKLPDTPDQIELFYQIAGLGKKLTEKSEEKDYSKTLIQAKKELDELIREIYDISDEEWNQVQNYLGRR